MTEEVDDEDLALPEHDFTYSAGTVGRPYSQFVSRWRAMRPHLADMLQACGSDRPLRVLDVGSCSGFFSLQAAYRHPEADVVGIEGSVGVGNGAAGLAGGARQILSTRAVQTNLRWIQRLQLQNCFVAPEVWDYARVAELVNQGRPIGDVMFMLSVVHHINDVSSQQYAEAGFTSQVDGFIDLLGKLLMLAPRHFVELPGRNYLTAVHERYGSPRAILEAAAATTGRQMSFKGPIHNAEWYGQREVWIVETLSSVPPLDLQACPFLLLYRGEEPELKEVLDDPANDQDPLDSYSRLDNFGKSALAPARPGDAPAVGAGHRSKDAYQPGMSDPMSVAELGLPLPNAKDLDGRLTACEALGGLSTDPGLMLLQSTPFGPADHKIAAAVSSAPTDLLVAHLTLREAVREAEDMLSRVRTEVPTEAGTQPQQQQQQHQPPQQPQPQHRQQPYGGHPSQQPLAQQQPQYQYQHYQQPPIHEHHHYAQGQQLLSQAQGQQLFQAQGRYAAHSAESAAIAARTSAMAGRGRVM